MTGYIPDIIKQVARDLRKQMTESEEMLWSELRGKKLGIKFLRQKPIYVYTENNGHDRYIIPDFCSLEIKLIIEVDGNIHNKQTIYRLDREKEKLLQNKGFKVLRIKNNEIQDDLDTVLEKIQKSFP